MLAVRSAIVILEETGITKNNESSLVAWASGPRSGWLCGSLVLPHTVQPLCRSKQHSTPGQMPGLSASHLLCQPVCIPECS